MKAVMTGNEAVARGAWEAGVEFASAYPGTPSTEILENMAKYKEDLYCEWAPNEKVALEAAIGASVAGVRSLAAMKHVGVNVAADPLFTFAYTGVTGGMVLISADDPGMHSSQNEQDNRNYAMAAHVLMLEPSDSQEAKDFTKLAFELSERFDTPVLLRLTTRICHSKSMVTLEDRETKEMVPYKKNIKKFVATPANGKVMRKNLEQRIADMEAYATSLEANQPEYHQREKGIITSGIAYQYAKEAFGTEASYLKLGMTYPLPKQTIEAFAREVEEVYVVEELDPYMENQIRAMGIVCRGKELIPAYDELSADLLRRNLLGEEVESLEVDMEPVNRPPTLCAGCPHRGFFYVLSKKKNVVITGDIGCYTLGSAPPLSAMDTCFCMGGSVSTGHGASIALKRAGKDTRVVSLIGDSTFFHSGVNSLMDAVYNGGTNVTVILDNRTTGMTGHQNNPGTGYTLMGDPAKEVDIPRLCEAVGIKEENIYVVNPNQLKEVDRILDEALKKDEASVIITKWPCFLKKFTPEDKEAFPLPVTKSEIDQEACVNCKRCVGTGCPCIYSTKEEVRIDPGTCTGCSICRQVCPFDAIREVKV